VRHRGPLALIPFSQCHLKVTAVQDEIDANDRFDNGGGATLQRNAVHPTPAQLNLRHGLCDQFPLNARCARTNTEDLGGRGPRMVNFGAFLTPLPPSSSPSSRGAVETISRLDKARRQDTGGSSTR
jgi:hypothetical protein